MASGCVDMLASVGAYEGAHGAIPHQACACFPAEIGSVTDLADLSVDRAVSAPRLACGGVVGARVGACDFSAFKEIREQGVTGGSVSGELCSVADFGAFDLSVAADGGVFGLTVAQVEFARGRAFEVSGSVYVAVFVARFFAIVERGTVAFLGVTDDSVAADIGGDAGGDVDGAIVVARQRAGCVFLGIP